MSIFTRRHYIWTEQQFAAALCSTPCATDREVIWETIFIFAAALEQQSSQFDKNLFVAEIQRLFVDLSARDAVAAIPVSSTTSNNVGT